MPTPLTSQDDIERTLTYVEEALRDGFPPPGKFGGGAISEGAARAHADGFVRSVETFTARIRRLRTKGIEPDWTMWRPAVYQAPERRVAPLEQFPIGPVLKPSGKRVKVCVIGDCHDDPRLDDKARFTWMGRWCAEEEPDYIVQLGDWATFDSMSRHEEKGSVGAQEQPSWMQDLDSLGLSVSAFEAGLKAPKVTKLFTEGNHEQRAYKYENSNPNLAGTLVPSWKSIFRGSGWRLHEFGEYAFIEGVGFIHYVINGAGKAYGGKTGNQRVGNDSLFSIVHGHDHRLERTSAQKVGPMGHIDTISAGCSLPWGWYERYGKLSPTGWWWGVNTMVIQDGIITDRNEISMLQLEERFADKKKLRKAA